MEPSSSSNAYNRPTSSGSSSGSRPERSSSSQAQNLEAITANALAFNHRETRSTALLENRLRRLTNFKSSLPIISKEFENILKEYMLLDHGQKNDCIELLAKVCVQFSDVIKAQNLLSPLLIGSWDEATLHMLLEITNRLIGNKPFVRNPDFRFFLDAEWLVASSKTNSSEETRIYIDLIRAVKNYQVYMGILAKIQKDNSEISYERAEASLLLFSAVWILFAKKLQKFKGVVKPPEEELLSVARTFTAIRKFFAGKSEEAHASSQPQNTWLAFGRSLNLYPDERAPLAFRMRCCMVRERLEEKLSSKGLTPASSEVCFANTDELRARLLPFLNMPLVSPLDFILETVVSADMSSYQGMDQLPHYSRQAQIDLERILDQIALGGLQIVELDDPS